jgi:hypothetical protein
MQELATYRELNYIQREVDGRKRKPQSHVPLAVYHGDCSRRLGENSTNTCEGIDNEMECVVGF